MSRAANEAEATRVKIHVRNECLRRQSQHTQNIIQSLGTLEHVPAQVRHLYRAYLDSLMDGRIYAYRFMLDDVMHD